MNDKSDSTGDLNKVSIEVDGVRYEGWKSARIEIGIEQICRGFVVAVTDNFPGNKTFSRLRPGQAVTLRIGQTTVCTGYITSTPITYDAKSVSVQIQGKSKTVDLVDCCSPWAAIAASSTNSAKPSGDQWKDVKTDKPQKQTPAVKPSKTVNTSWHNQTTAQIISDLCAPYGIKVICEVEGLNSKISNFTVNPGEKVFDSINRLLTKDNLVITDNEFGDLVITKPGSQGDCADRLEVGKNILSGTANFDASKIFSTYAVLGQHKGSDLEFGKKASQDKGIAHSDNCQRYRLLVLKDTGQSSESIVKNRAQFEALFRNAQLYKSTHRVQGWRQENGNLWLPNMKVNLLDTLLRIKGVYLVQSVTLTIDSSGLIAEITTIDPDAYDRPGAKQEVKKSNPSGGSSSGSGWEEVK